MGTLFSLEELCNLMAQLRGAEGCDWDKAQTLSSLKPYTLEEAYEVVDAVHQLELNDTPDNRQAHCDELGDLLLQVIFQAQLQKEAGYFDINDVIQSITQKLIRRHPHIFGDAPKKEDPEGKNPYWAQVKLEERKEKNEVQMSALDAIPSSLPALLLAYQTSEKSGQTGFEYPDLSYVLRDLQSEIEELKEAIEEGNRQHMSSEAGDVLYAAVNTCRFLKINPELALRECVQRFGNRFRYVEKLASEQKLDLKTLALDKMLTLWSEAKKREKTPQTV